MNVIDYHVPSIVHEKAWRDTGAIVRGRDVDVLIQSFDRVWLGSLRAWRQGLRRRKQKPQSSDLVRLNLRSRQRHDNYLDLLVRIVRAQRRVWITNAYFVPDGSLLRVLSIAAKSGVEVRILVPRFTDVFFIPWVSSALHYGLLEAGVKVFEYTRTVLHAKTMLIDDWGLVGSSNLNHRSLLHDLEADVVITGAEARSSLERQFELDLGCAEQITLETWRKRPVLERWIGRVLLAFRYLL
jgi:cardiolipin synthase